MKQHETNNTKPHIPRNKQEGASQMQGIKFKEISLDLMCTGGNPV